MTTETINILINGVDNFSKAFDSVTNKMQRLQTRMRTFDMRLLSTMFFGMQMQRTFEGALRSMSDTFNKVEADSGMLNKSTMKVSAAFEFLKFSIWNAFEQSGLTRIFIDALVNMINFVSKLINKYPDLGTAIVGVFGAGGALGYAMFMISQFVLFTDAMFGVGGLLTSILKKSIPAIQTLFGSMGNAFQIGVGFYYAYDTLKELSEGDIIGGLTSISLSGGYLAWMMKDIKGTKILLGISAGLNVIGAIFDPAKMNDASWWFDQAMAMGSIGALVKIGGSTASGAVIGVAAALIIGEVLFNWPEIKKNIKSGGEDLATQTETWAADLDKMFGMDKWKPQTLKLNVDTSEASAKIFPINESVSFLGNTITNITDTALPALNTSLTTGFDVNASIPVLTNSAFSALNDTIDFVTNTTMPSWNDTLADPSLISSTSNYTNQLNGQANAAERLAEALERAERAARNRTGYYGPVGGPRDDSTTSSTIW